MRLIKREVQMGPPVLGKLRKGGKKRKNPNGGREIVGLDLDHFRFDAGGAAIEQDFFAMYGDKPNNILITFDGEIDEVWSSCYETYDSKGNVKQRHDTETVWCWMDQDGKKYAADFTENPYLKFKNYAPVPMDRLPDPDPTAKQVGRLSFNVFGLGRDFGVILFETHSINDILMIDDYLTQATQRYGTMRSIPFILSRSVRKISTPDVDRQGKKQSEKRLIREKSLVMLNVHPDWFLQWEANQRTKLGINNVPLALLEQRQINQDTGEIRFGGSADDVLEMDENFYDDGDDDEPEDGEFVPAPAPTPAPRKAPPPPAPAQTAGPSANDTDLLEKAGTTTMGPNWAAKKEEIMAVWGGRASELVESLKNSAKLWQGYGRSMGDMPQPQSEAPQPEATAQQVIDDQKILV